MLTNALFQAIQGYITDIFGYNVNIICFVILSCVSALLVVVLWIVDKRGYEILNSHESVGIYRDDVTYERIFPI